MYQEYALRSEQQCKVFGVSLEKAMAYQRELFPELEIPNFLHQLYSYIRKNGTNTKVIQATVLIFKITIQDFNNTEFSG